jgi:hypothetical protein
MSTAVLWLVPAMLFGGAAGQTPVTYEPVRASHEAKISDQPCAVPRALQTQQPYVVLTELRNWSATVVETNSTVVPYDQARACIRLQGPGSVVRHIAIGDFRTLRLHWVSERLLYVFTDVGHIAGVGQLFDVVDATRIYARTEIYPPTDRR